MTEWKMGVNMKILIAEDEYYARARLVKIINECGQGMELAAAVENGQEAVEFLEQNTDVDAVITDVIMPRMSGLELASYVHNNMPYIQVIIVSGYEEFEYARKAIEYEVRQYLVKPVKKEQLLEALEMLMEKQENFLREVEEMVQERLSDIPDQYLSSKQILTSPSLIRIHLPDYDIAPEESCCRVVVIQLERELNCADASLIHKALSQRTEGMEYSGFFCKVNDEYVIIFWGKPSSPGTGRKMDETICQMAQQLLHYLMVQLKSSVTIGLSRPFERKDMMEYEAYKECLYAMNVRLLQGWNKVYEYQSVRGPENCFDTATENALTGALQLPDYQKAKELVHGLLYQETLRKSGDVNAYHDMILGILKTANRQYRELCEEQDGIERKVEIMFSRRYDLYSFKQPEQLEEYLLDILREICDAKQNLPGSGGNAIIKDILHYVEHNYQYDLSLQELAEKKYFMNSSYLSRLFKSAVGKTFSRYCIELRIEKARELLSDKQLKINDIAAQVGYNNTSHFIQSFKKLCGCTPEEYRNSVGRSSKPAKDAD